MEFAAAAAAAPKFFVPGLCSGNPTANRATETSKPPFRPLRPAMSRPEQISGPIVRSLRQCSGASARPRSIAMRQFSATASRKEETGTQHPSGFELTHRASAGSQWTLEQLEKLASPSEGSLRRRAALATSYNIPFEQMPYQCFQEARKILNQDRQKKITQIIAQTEKIKRLEATDPNTLPGGETLKQKRLANLKTSVERLKIFADINDPLVKRRFEDGMGTRTHYVHPRFCPLQLISMCNRRHGQAYLPLPC